MQSIEELIQKAKSLPRRTVAVAAAHDADVLRAVTEARRDGICDAVLVGDAARIREILSSLSESADNFTILDTAGEPDAVTAERTVALVEAGKADFLMKGLLNTTDMLRPVVHSKLVTDRLLSHVMLYEAPAYHKLLALTDGGMNPYPDLAKKTDILENAAWLLGALGYQAIVAACVCGSEVVSPKIPATVDAESLAKMDRWAAFSMTVLGPVGLDLAISPAACRHKRFDKPGAGEADILLVPSYDVGNGIGKTLTYFGNAKSAGVVVGASAPIVLVSRADDAETKLSSLALGSIVALGGTDR